MSAFLTVEVQHVFAKIQPSESATKAFADALGYDQKTMNSGFELDRVIPMQVALEGVSGSAMACIHAALLYEGAFYEDHADTDPRTAKRLQIQRADDVLKRAGQTPIILVLSQVDLSESFFFMEHLRSNIEDWRQLQYKQVASFNEYETSPYWPVGDDVGAFTIMSVSETNSFDDSLARLQGDAEVFDVVELQTDQNDGDQADVAVLLLDEAWCFEQKATSKFSTIPRPSSNPKPNQPSIAEKVANLKKRLKAMFEQSPERELVIYPHVNFAGQVVAPFIEQLAKTDVKKRIKLAPAIPEPTVLKVLKGVDLGMRFEVWRDLQLLSPRAVTDADGIDESLAARILILEGEIETRKADLPKTALSELEQLIEDLTVKAKAFAQLLTTRFEVYAKEQQIAVDIVDGVVGAPDQSHAIWGNGKDSNWNIKPKDLREDDRSFKFDPIDELVVSDQAITKINESIEERVEILGRGFEALYGMYWKKFVVSDGRSGIANILGDKTPPILASIQFRKLPTDTGVKLAKLEEVSPPEAVEIVSHKSPKKILGKFKGTYKFVGKAAGLLLTLYLFFGEQNIPGLAGITNFLAENWLAFVGVFLVVAVVTTWVMGGPKGIGQGLVSDLIEKRKQKKIDYQRKLHSKADDALKKIIQSWQYSFINYVDQICMDFAHAMNTQFGPLLVSRYDQEVQFITDRKTILDKLNTREKDYLKQIESEKSDFENQIKTTKKRLHKSLKSVHQTLGGSDVK